MFGKPITLQSGETLRVDEAYLRESILQPGARITAGFQPIMPTFQGLVSEEGLLQLIEYVKSLKADDPPSGVRPSTAGAAQSENRPAQSQTR